MKKQQHPSYSDIAEAEESYEQSKAILNALDNLQKRSYRRSENALSLKIYWQGDHQEIRDAQERIAQRASSIHQSRDAMIYEFSF